MRISFNRPPFVGKETEYIKEAVEKNGMICGDGPFTKKCSEWMKDRFQTKNVLLTTSCTACTGNGGISGGYPARR